jgi:cytidine deaminase
MNAAQSPTTLSPAEQAEVVRAALAVQTHAYAPYSRFHVGAAILSEAGEIFAGANMENASYGLTICAERIAAGAALAASPPLLQPGTAPWKAIAVASRGGVTPCGACRQVLMEFAPRMRVLLIDSLTGTVADVGELAGLLPAAFVFPDVNAGAPSAR